ncbi:hypothetical protein [Pseudonocardia hydrocarbonoxydans]|uniref:Uncharacterized protein n=1 Tax=Pseudonocardia hydrocarbonoxydans TaxID=76726 RepID=A0A4Y3WVM8_9PSEU|nr:hypothetical protein [Pseudonocardia hydrocarbonoxydans]GEC22952.1 hypothetical protein PHY01_52350 [Pseudonocardia hydrocarbonoxydans]
MIIGDRGVSREHARLQAVLAALREYWDEPTERSTDHIAAEAVDVLRRLTDAARHVRARADRITTEETP